MTISISQYGPDVRDAIAKLVETTIENEYRRATQVEIRAARKTATDAVTRAGDNGGEYSVMILARHGLDARRCQRADRPCQGHYEHDVPQVNGRYHCGPCHIDLTTREEAGA